MACLKSSSSISFKEIEFTIDFPWTRFKPSSIAAHFDEPIMKGGLATFGSVRHMRINFPIADCPSIKSESKLKFKTQLSFHTERRRLPWPRPTVGIDQLLNFAEPTINESNATAAKAAGVRAAAGSTIVENIAAGELGIGGCTVVCGGGHLP